MAREWVDWEVRADDWADVQAARVEEEWIEPDCGDCGDIPEDYSAEWGEWAEEVFHED